MSKLTTLILFVLALGTAEVMAQNSSLNPIPNVFLDCSGNCNQTYIRTNITQVNYVRDQDDADIYLRITSAGTGSGSEYVMDFRGVPPYSSRRDTLYYYTPDTDTNDEERAGLVRYVRVGLVPFLVNTVAMEGLNVTYTPPAVTSETVTVEAEDPWNYWVFRVGMNASLNGQSSDKNLNLSGDFSFERITEDWKIDGGFSGNINRREVELSSGTLTINRDSWFYNGMAAYSISNHASVGIFTQMNSSRTSNLKYNAEIAPAFEYSVFPYDEFQERRILFVYRLTPSFRHYHNTTIYLKDKETVLQHYLSGQLRYDQPWGFVNVSLSYSSYFHDFSFNRFDFNPSVNIRIIRGLNFNVSGRYSSINNQISLPAGDISDEDALTGARQRATSYNYFLQFGLNYTFGSRFSTVVNPRF